MSKALPDLFRACNVERLAHYFRAMQETLAGLAPFNRDNPRVVLLTPGPHHATYFEQAYLAQYLGYTLASGGDLTVRDDRVYLKTLSGLQPVDVVLRRVNDDYCDPLELRQESVLGVSGLVQAVRQGTVALANPLGTGLVQSPALLPYLPVVARQLLGEELKLTSAETFWCGDARALPVVLDRFATMVLKPAFAEGVTHPVFGAGCPRPSGKRCARGSSNRPASGSPRRRCPPRPRRSSRVRTWCRGPWSCGPMPSPPATAMP